MALDSGEAGRVAERQDSHFVLEALAASSLGRQLGLLLLGLERLRVALEHSGVDARAGKAATLQSTAYTDCCNPMPQRRNNQ